MARFANNVLFTPNAGGLGDFVVSANVQGYMTPAQAGAVTGTYKYRAESADLSQWEIGEGTYTSGTVTLTRTTILLSSTGAKVNFTAAPNVGIVVTKEDMISPDEANSFTTTQKSQIRTNVGVGIRGEIGGLWLSTAGASSSFSIAAGECADSTNVDMMALAAAITKTTGAWAVGSGNGALDTGTIATNTWYHAHLIKRVDTGVVDVLVSLSPTAPTMPANYTLRRRIGAMKTNASSQWIKFTQIGDEFLWDVPVQDANAQSPGTTGTNYVMSVPTGIKVNAIGFAAWFFVSSGNYLKVYSPDTTGSAVGATNFSLYSNSGTTPGTTGYNIRTNTSAQIAARADGTGGSMYLITDGWIDTRDRHA